MPIVMSPVRSPVVTPRPPMKMRRSPALAATTLTLQTALGASAFAQAGAPVPDLAWIDLDNLNRGAIEVRTGKDESGAATVDVAVMIDAEPRAIWEVLTACEIAPEYVPDVVDCRLIETVDDGHSELFVQTVKPAFFLPSFEHVFRLDYEPYTRIDVSHVSGPIDRMDGTWWLLEQPDDVVLLVHSLEVDPGMPVPRFIVRAALKRNLPKAFEAVRERAEAMH